MNTARTTLSQPDLARRMKGHDSSGTKAHLHLPKLSLDVKQHPLRDPRAKARSLEVGHINRQKIPLVKNSVSGSSVVSEVSRPSVAASESQDRVSQHEPVELNSNHGNMADRYRSNDYSSLGKSDVSALEQAFVEQPTRNYAKRSVRPRFDMSKFLYGFATVAFLFAVYVSIQTYRTNIAVHQQVGAAENQTLGASESAPQESGDNPSERIVSDGDLLSYQVSPEMPRYLRIPSIDVLARVKHTGRTADGAVDAPNNINDVSWYNEGALPGSDSGASLILGHVQGWTAPGVFKNINKLSVGSIFYVEKGSGETLKYTVTRTEEVPLEELEMGKILSEEVKGEHDLKLMTYSGRYNSTTETYESRFIVYAKIIS